MDGPSAVSAMEETMDIDPSVSYLPESTPQVHERSGLDTYFTPLQLAPDGTYVRTFRGAHKSYGKGVRFGCGDQNDIHSEGQEYYPFTGFEEFELAVALDNMGASLSGLDKLLNTRIFQRIGLSFNSGQKMCDRLSMLPDVPRWKSCSVDFGPNYPTTTPATLYFRDSMECLQSLFCNPILGKHMDFEPKLIFRDPDERTRIYNEMMTGNWATESQSKLPGGATLLGIVLASDKTNLSVGTGNQKAHPLYLSIGNLHSSVRNKASYHAFILLALLPIVDFQHPDSEVRSGLGNRLMHNCIAMVTKSFRDAAETGVMLTGPSGDQHLCFTPLASYMVDNPEARDLACVINWTSPITTASYLTLGDSYRHPTRSGIHTLQQIDEIANEYDPWDSRTISPFIKTGKERYRINGVLRPFWADWRFSDPAWFLTPDYLHGLHKEFLDHDFKWSREAIGSQELDARFKAIQPIVGRRHFKNGVSHLSQVTGREQRDIERYLVSVLAGAVPPKFLKCIRAMMDFRYLAQMEHPDEIVLNMMQEALSEFHMHKSIIVQNGYNPSERAGLWAIPKLELMQSVTASMSMMGAATQWSTERSENAHIELVKEPFRASNHRDFEEQMVRYLDLQEKKMNFDLILAVKNAGGIDGLVAAEEEEDGNENEDGRGSSGNVGSAQELVTIENLAGPKRKITDYFAQFLLNPDKGRTFVTNTTAFHLNTQPTRSSLPLAEASQLYHLGDEFLGALLEFWFGGGLNPDRPAVLGGRRTASYSQDALPFTNIEVWDNVKIQTRTTQLPSTYVRKAQSVQAIPPGC